MAFTPCSVATNNIATVGTDVAARGLTTDQFKALFDKYGVDFVTYFNAVHLVELNANSFPVSGAWTPVLAGATTPGTNTYTTQTGSYYKVGKLVIAKFDVKLSAKDAAMAGALMITGLPFVCSDNFPAAFSRIEGVTIGASYTHVSGYSDVSRILLTQTKGTWDNVLPADISAVAVFRGAITYIAT